MFVIYACYAGVFKQVNFMGFVVGEQTMKKYKIFLIGVLSLVIFGLLLPQPIQALIVLVESPIKDFFFTTFIITMRCSWDNSGIV